MLQAPSDFFSSSFSSIAILLFFRRCFLPSWFFTYFFPPLFFFLQFFSCRLPIFRFSFRHCFFSSRAKPYLRRHVDLSLHAFPSPIDCKKLIPRSSIIIFLMISHQFGFKWLDLISV